MMATKLKQQRCQAGHALNGGGWILWFRQKRDGKKYRRCLNKSSMNVNNECFDEKSDPKTISLCGECNRTSLG
jgi:hypothetical protein